MLDKTQQPLVKTGWRYACRLLRRSTEPPAGTGAGPSMAVYAVLLLVLAAATLTRFEHSYKGLPYVHSPDEYHIAQHALEMMQTGDYNPHFFRYGSLMIYLNLLVDIVHYCYLLSRSTGEEALRSLSSIEVSRWFISHPSFYLWNRWLTAAMGVGCVGFSFLLAQRLQGAWAGVVAAVFLAGLPYHVERSSMIATDLPASFFLLAASVLGLLHLENKRPSLLLAASFAVGLAASTKYNSAYGLVIPIAAALLGDAGKSWRVWPGIFASAAAGFFIFTPYAIFDLPAFLHSAGAEIYHYSVQGHSQPKTVFGGLPHLLHQIVDVIVKIGPYGFLLAAFGLVALLKKRLGWILLLLAAANLILLTRTVVSFPRNFIIVYPIIAVAVGCGAVQAARVAHELLGDLGLRSRLARGAVVVVLAVASLLYLGTSLRTGREIRSAVDTRTLAISTVNELFEKERLRTGAVGIARSLRIHPLDLQRIDLGILYRVRPESKLLANFADYDVLVIPSDTTPDAAPEHEPLLAGAYALEELADHGVRRIGSRIVNPGILVAMPRDPVSGRADRPPEQTMRPPTCGRTIGMSALEELTKAHARLTEDELEIAIRGTVTSSPCRLAAGSYSFSWRGSAAQEVVTAQLIEHLTAADTRVLAERNLLLKEKPFVFFDLVHLAGPADVSLRIQWRRGPGAGDSGRKIYLSSTAEVQEHERLRLGTAVRKVLRSFADSG